MINRYFEADATIHVINFTYTGNALLRVTIFFVHLENLSVKIFYLYLITECKRVYMNIVGNLNVKKELFLYFTREISYKYLV